VSSKLNEHIIFELGQLRRLLAEGHDLIESCKIHAPDTASRWALGAMLYYRFAFRSFKKTKSVFEIRSQSRF
jgi:hypothetical protein